jgi:hypothetical protein
LDKKKLLGKQENLNGAKKRNARSILKINEKTLNKNQKNFNQFSFFKMNKDKCGTKDKPGCSDTKIRGKLENN